MDLQPRSCAVVVGLALALGTPDAGYAQTPGLHAVELVGSASVAGDTRDKSGLAGLHADGSPQDLLGGFGSAIAWTREGSRYVTAVDRGPGDGSCAFRDRLQTFDIRVVSAGASTLEVNLVSTTMLVDELDRPLIGAATAFDPQNPANSVRFDPEGIRVSRQATYFVSDEYGPWICEFSTGGKLLRRLAVPKHFAVAHPGADDEEKFADNTQGRVSNRGFEGLAITPDGKRLLALLQSPLIQDHGRDGVVCRLLEIVIESGATRELCVVLSKRRQCFNEIVAIDDHRFLAIERDGEQGEKARSKSIVLLDIAHASDVSANASLPAEDVPDGVRAVAKSRILDLLEPRFALAGADFPAKIEGLCFGPDLSDGRHLLLVTSDNDYRVKEASRVWAFAIPSTAIPGFDTRAFAARPHDEPAGGSR